MTEHIRTKKSAILASVLAVVLVCGLLPYPSARAYADPSLATKQAQAQEALDKLNAMQGELNAASDNYANAEEERANAQARVQQVQEQIEQETAKISEYQGELATRARSMYRTGGNTFLDVLLGASTFQEFATNWNMLETMNQNDAELVSKTKESRAKVQEAKVEYETQEAVATEKANEAKRIQDQAEAKTAEIQAVYNGLSSEVQELIRQEEAAREAADQAAAIQDIANNTAGDAAANNAGITNNPPANNNNNNNNNNSGNHNNASNNSGNQGSSNNATNSGGSHKPSSGTNNSKPQTVTGNVVVDRAYAQLGKPYKWAAVGPNSFDCSGLVGYCLTGRYSRLATTATIARWTRVSNPRPGDICVYHDYSSGNGHTGVYIGNGQMIHAPRSGDVVKVSAVQSRMWYVRY